MTARRTDDRSDEQALQDWSDWANRIKVDLLETFWSLEVLERLRSVYLANKKLQDVGGYLWEWARMNHAYATLMRLRREVDTQSNTVNVLRLLSEIQDRPSVFSRQRIVARADGQATLADLLDRDFAAWKPIASPHGREFDHINPMLVSADIKSLLDAVDEVATYTSRTVAHRTWEKPKPIEREAVDGALKTVDEIFRKYYALVCGSSLTSLTPTPQYNTDELFTFAWKP
jgi:hypothetical protein